MPKIKVNDISMYYEIHGTGEPLVLIAGFSADNTTWTPALEILKQRFQVIVFDNRGAGQTDAPLGKYSIQQLAADTAGLCAALGIKQAHFVGNSMGGFILQELALNHAGLVKSAIISNSTTNIDCVFHLYVAAQLELLKANAPLRALIQASCCWAFSFRFLSLPNMLDTLIEIGMNNPYPFSIAGYEGQYAALDQFSSRDWANKIDVPVLVIAGDQDLIFSEASIRELAENIPSARYHCFQGCGHLPMLEYPQQFADLVSEFVNAYHA
jgi:pimeloyl-ACP methyl ester carboxylesterase